MSISLKSSNGVDLRRTGLGAGPLSSHCVERRLARRGPARGKGWDEGAWEAKRRERGAAGGADRSTRLAAGIVAGGAGSRAWPDEVAVLRASFSPAQLSGLATLKSNRDNEEEGEEKEFVDVLD